MFAKFFHREVVEEEPVLTFGTPVPCPACGGPTRLGRIDIGARMQHQHCFVCEAHAALPESHFLPKAS